MKRGSNSGAIREIGSKVTTRQQLPLIRWENGGPIIPIAKEDVWTLEHFWLEVCINAIFLERNVATSFMIKNTYMSDSESALPGIYPLGVKALRPKDVFSQECTPL